MSYYGSGDVTPPLSSRRGGNNANYDHNNNGGGATNNRMNNNNNQGGRISARSPSPAPYNNNGGNHFSVASPAPRMPSRSASPFRNGVNGEGGGAAGDGADDNTIMSTIPISNGTANRKNNDSPTLLDGIAEKFSSMQRSVSRGWTSFLAENFPSALDNADGSGRSPDQNSHNNNNNNVPGSARQGLPPLANNHQQQLQRNNSAFFSRGNFSSNNSNNASFALNSSGNLHNNNNNTNHSKPNYRKLLKSKLGLLREQRREQKRLALLEQQERERNPLASASHFISSAVKQSLGRETTPATTTPSSRPSESDATNSQEKKDSDDSSLLDLFRFSWSKNEITSKNAFEDRSHKNNNNMNNNNNYDEDDHDDGGDTDDEYDDFYDHDTENGALFGDSSTNNNNPFVIVGGDQRTVEDLKENYVDKRYWNLGFDATKAELDSFPDALPDNELPRELRMLDLLLKDRTSQGRAVDSVLKRRLLENYPIFTAGMEHVMEVSRDLESTATDCRRARQELAHLKSTFVVNGLKIPRLAQRKDRMNDVVDLLEAVELMQMRDREMAQLIKECRFHEALELAANGDLIFSGELAATLKGVKVADKLNENWKKMTSSLGTLADGSWDQCFARGAFDDEKYEGVFETHALIGTSDPKRVADVMSKNITGSIMLGLVGSSSSKNMTDLRELVGGVVPELIVVTVCQMAARLADNIAICLRVEKFHEEKAKEPIHAEEHEEQRNISPNQSRTTTTTTHPGDETPRNILPPLNFSNFQSNSQAARAPSMPNQNGTNNNNNNSRAVSGARAASLPRSNAVGGSANSAPRSRVLPGHSRSISRRGGSLSRGYFDDELDQSVNLGSSIATLNPNSVNTLNGSGGAAGNNNNNNNTNNSVGRRNHGGHARSLSGGDELSNLVASTFSRAPSNPGYYSAASPSSHHQHQFSGGTHETMMSGTMNSYGEMMNVDAATAAVMITKRTNQDKLLRSLHKDSLAILRQEMPKIGFAVQRDLKAVAEVLALSSPHFKNLAIDSALHVFYVLAMAVETTTHLNVDSYATRASRDTLRLFSKELVKEKVFHPGCRAIIASLVEESWKPLPEDRGQNELDIVTGITPKDYQADRAAVKNFVTSTTTFENNPFLLPHMVEQRKDALESLDTVKAVLNPYRNSVIRAVVRVAKLYFEITCRIVVRFPPLAVEVAEWNCDVYSMYLYVVAATMIGVSKTEKLYEHYDFHPKAKMILCELEKWASNLYEVSFHGQSMIVRVGGGGGPASSTVTTASATNSNPNPNQTTTQNPNQPAPPRAPFHFEQISGNPNSNNVMNGILPQEMPTMTLAALRAAAAANSNTRNNNNNNHSNSQSDSDQNDGVDSITNNNSNYQHSFIGRGQIEIRLSENFPPPVYAGIHHAYESAENLFAATERLNAIESCFPLLEVLKQSVSSVKEVVGNPVTKAANERIESLSYATDAILHVGCHRLCHALFPVQLLVDEIADSRWDTPHLSLVTTSIHNNTSGGGNTTASSSTATSTNYFATTTATAATNYNQPPPKQYQLSPEFKMGEWTTLLQNRCRNFFVNNAPRLKFGSAHLRTAYWRHFVFNIQSSMVTGFARSGRSTEIVVAAMKAETEFIHQYLKKLFPDPPAGSSSSSSSGSAFIRENHVLSFLDAYSYDLAGRVRWIRDNHDFYNSEDLTKWFMNLHQSSIARHQMDQLLKDLKHSDCVPIEMFVAVENKEERYRA